ncbi:MAG TPA: amino acid ABC transporter permease [Firmicutes bacterium]|nr:amino acid ABC transporter permease [Candidatus Fermentithermobacillaceae bacterium]
MTYDLGVVRRYLPFLLNGIGITFRFTVVAFVLGAVLGLVVALGRIQRNPFMRLPCVWYTDFIRGTPLLAQIYLIHFGLPQVLGYKPVGWIDAMVALTINAGAYIAEIWRGAIESIDPGQMEAARSLGMTYSQAMRYVILPQSFKRAIPPLGNEFIALLKESCLVSVIGLEDLMMRANMMSGRSFRPFEAYFTVALIYLIMTLGFSRLVARLEGGLKRGRS